MEIQKDPSVNKVATSIRALEMKIPPALLQVIGDGIRERFGIGKYITQAKVHGGVGDELTIRLGGINLAEILPPGAKFRGVRQISNEKKKTEYETSHFHHYNYVSRECRFIVESNSSEQYKRPIQNTRINALIILHEVGHAWRDYNHPQDRLELMRNRIPTSLLRSLQPDDVFSWYRASQDYARRHLGATPRDEMRKLISIECAHSLDALYEALAIWNDVPRLIPLADREELRRSIVASTQSNILARYDGFSATAHGLWAAVLEEQTQTLRSNEIFERESTKREELGAWDVAMIESYRLQATNPKIQFWDGSMDELNLLKAFFILHHEGIELDDIADDDIRNKLKQIADPRKLSPR